ncbi:MAG: hypothetical protein JXA77_08095 [Bacteroidales bacterium]|nr:hypothetical protein [Bacteroidales bacterium]MBN2818592.1 hypothetical protein [Bacteroidales bacterium]
MENNKNTQLKMEKLTVTEMTLIRGGKQQPEKPKKPKTPPELISQPYNGEDY